MDEQLEELITTQNNEFHELREKISSISTVMQKDILMKNYQKIPKRENEVGFPIQKCICTF